MPCIFLLPDPDLLNPFWGLKRARPCPILIFKDYLAHEIRCWHKSPRTERFLIFWRSSATLKYWITTSKTGHATNVPLAGIRDCKFHSVPSDPPISASLFCFSRQITMPQRLVGAWHRSKGQQQHLKEKPLPSLKCRIRLMPCSKKCIDFTLKKRWKFSYLSVQMQFRAF